MKLISQVLLVLAVVAAVAGGLLLLVRDSNSGGGIEIVLPTATAEPVVDLKVYVTGAVRDPGVYAVEQGSRLVRAIEAAGGATEEADLSAVNLAARMTDEQHWHIPKLGEVVRPPSTEAPAGSKKLDINSASVELLKSLPNIGEVRAQAIVSYREANGPYSSVEALLEVNGIGPATLEWRYPFQLSTGRSGRVRSRCSGKAAGSTCGCTGRSI